LLLEVEVVVLAVPESIGIDTKLMVVAVVDPVVLMDQIQIIIVVTELVVAAELNQPGAPVLVHQYHQDLV